MVRQIVQMVDQAENRPVRVNRFEVNLSISSNAVLVGLAASAGDFGMVWFMLKRQQSEDILS